MPRLSFADLVPIYRATTFDGEGPDGTLIIADGAMIPVITRIDQDQEDADDAGIVLLSDLDDVGVGAQVRVRIGAPRIGLGVFARTFGTLIEPRAARIAEPPRYYVRELDFARGDAAVPAPVALYRTALSLVALFGEAVSYLDAVRAELVFVKDGKIAIPVEYGPDALSRIQPAEADLLLKLFDPEEHREQKLEILGEAIVDLARSQRTVDRFPYLLANLDALRRTVLDGYRLFASSFSYAKIREELEDAKIDYAAKIHKTIVDIQAQILGLPVASVVVASQLKLAKACSLELWTDVAVLAGAWIFVGLLMFGIVNQWLTLGVLAKEIARQKKQLQGDYARIANRFEDVFVSLGRRIVWHRAVLAAIAVIAIVGASFATVAFDRVAQGDVPACLRGDVAIGNAV